MKRLDGCVVGFFIGVLFSIVYWRPEISLVPSLDTQTLSNQIEEMQQSLSLQISEQCGNGIDNIFQLSESLICNQKK